MDIIRVVEKKTKYNEETNAKVYSYDVLYDGELVRSVSNLNADSMIMDIDFLENLSCYIDFELEVEYYKESEL